jgi:hypothetical protein
MVRSSHSPGLRAELGCRAIAYLPRSGPGLDGAKRQLPDFAPYLGSAMPLSLVCFALRPGFSPGRFHSFAIGWGSHNDNSCCRCGESQHNPWRELRWLVHSNKHQHRLRVFVSSRRAVLLLAASCCSLLDRCAAGRGALPQGGPVDGPRPLKICSPSGSQRCFASYVKNSKTHIYRRAKAVRKTSQSSSGERW